MPRTLTLILALTLTLKVTVIYAVQLPNVRRKQRIPMTSRIGFLINVFRTQMCGQTLLFIVIAKGATEHGTFRIYRGLSVAHCDDVFRLTRLMCIVSHRFCAATVRLQRPCDDDNALLQIGIFRESRGFSDVMQFGGGRGDWGGASTVWELVRIARPSRSRVACPWCR